MDFRITESDEGNMVRTYLESHVDLSAKMLKYLKYRNHGILVNGKSVTTRYILHAGDFLTLQTEDREDQESLECVDLPLPILLEDDDFVVPDKPPYMPTHPSRDHYRDTVANALAFRYRTQGIPFVFRPINRLDRNTSGALLIARNKLSAGKLTKSMQKGLIRKTYLAILEGEDLPDEGIIREPICRSRESIIVRRVCGPDEPGAESAQTCYRVLCRQNGCSLVEAHPVTGRTHQLRVHFAFLGHPIVGDDLYGIPNGRASRQMLHARSLTFPHPKTGVQVSVTSPVPQDMSLLIADLFPEFAPRVFHGEVTS